MNRGIGLALLAGGIVLLIFGFQAANSFTSSVSKAFSGSPTNNSVWMIALGVVLTIVGLVLSFGSGRGTRL